MKNFSRFALGGLIIAFSSFQAQAQEFKASAVDGSVKLSGSSGLQYLQSTEMRYYTNGARASQLDWKSSNVLLNSAKVQATIDGWVLRASGSVGTGGNGHMVDRDWIAPFSTNDSDSDWSHRSISPNTKLDHFYQAGLEFGQVVYDANGAKIDITAGYKLTDVQWTAWGGSYIYSVNSFRDVTGDFGSVKGITFRQHLPVAYIGVNGSQNYGAWTFGGKIQLGGTVNAFTVDDHWLRNLHATERYRFSTALALAGSAQYNFSDHFSAFASANFDGVFRIKSNVNINDQMKNVTYKFTDQSGGDFMSAGVAVGLKATF